MIYNSSVFTAVVAAIYLHCVYHIRSQYQPIWYDALENCDHWTPRYGTIQCGYDSANGCQSGVCCKMESDSGGYSYIQRQTDISQYSSLQLQVSVSTLGMEAGDSCVVYHAYDNNNDNQPFQNPFVIKPPNAESHNYFDQTINLPSPVGRTTLVLWLENDGKDSDYCYWDNVYLRGIPNPTPKPTKQPTSNPIATRIPTADPTLPPTDPDPTTSPTPMPTASPTKPAGPLTLQCGQNATGSYVIGQSIIFHTTLPFEGQFIFDASGSDFAVTHIACYTALGAILAIDTNHDERVALTLPAGDYKCVIAGDTQTTAIYHAGITCVSENPTVSPTKVPTKRSTWNPTAQPIIRTTENPKDNPTRNPTPPSTYEAETATEAAGTDFDNRAYNPFEDAFGPIVVANVAMIAILSCCLVCVVIGCCVFRARRRREKNRNEEEIAPQLQLPNVAPPVVVPQGLIPADLPGIPQEPTQEPSSDDNAVDMDSEEQQPRAAAMAQWHNDRMNPNTDVQTGNEEVPDEPMHSANNAINMDMNTNIDDMKDTMAMDDHTDIAMTTNLMLLNTSGCGESSSSSDSSEQERTTGGRGTGGNEIELQTCQKVKSVSIDSCDALYGP